MEKRCYSNIVPVEGGIVQKPLHADVLLQQAVSQDGHGGEADVVHGQIGCIVQGLGRRERWRCREDEESRVGANEGLISWTPLTALTYNHPAGTPEVVDFTSRHSQVSRPNVDLSFIYSFIFIQKKCKGSSHLK